MAFLTDNFTGADTTNLTAHTPDVGGAWAKLTGFAGDLLISNANRARPEGVIAGVYYNAATPADVDYTITAKLHRFSNEVAGVIARADPATGDHYLCWINSGDLQLWRIQGGNNLLQSVTLTGISDGDDLWIKFECFDAAKKVYTSPDGVTYTEKISQADNGITAKGKVGLRGNNGSNSGGWHWDSITALDAAVPLSGTASTDAHTDTTADLSVIAAGGTAPYSYQWYRSTSNGFTPGAGNILSGKTGTTLNDTGLTAGTTYYYVCRVTDSAGSPGTADSNQVTVTTDATHDIAADAAGFTYTAPVVVAAGKATGISSGPVTTFVVHDSATCVLLFDTANSPAVDLQYRVNGGTVHRATLAATVSLTLPAGTGPHEVEVWANVYQSTSGLWASATGGYVFSGVRIDSGGSVSAPTSRHTVEFCGDSITSGILLLAASPNDQTSMGQPDNWPQLTVEALSTVRRAVQRGFGGTGLTTAGAGSVPASNANFPYKYASNAYSPAAQPDAVVIHYGTNDGADGPTFQGLYETYLATIRAARPDALILCLVPPTKDAAYATPITDAAATIDNVAVRRLFPVMGSAPGANYQDGVGHLNQTGAAVLAAYVAGQLNSLLGSEVSPSGPATLGNYGINLGLRLGL